MPNNKANVSTTRGVKGGYLFRAPVGTAGAPTKSSYKATNWLTNGNPPTGWECLGYIPEDGFTETVDKGTGDAIRDINLDTIDNVPGAATESITVGLMEIAKAPLAAEYGNANVSESGGTIEVKHNWADADEHYQYVFLLLLKNSRNWTKYIPDGQVTELGDLTGNKTTVAQREITITYNTDDNGNGCFDWIDSVTTTTTTTTGA